MKRICSISTQYCAFAISASADLVFCRNTNRYEFTLGEIRTCEIIDGVKSYRSELSILYINDFNRKVLERLFKESGLLSHPLSKTSLHVFTSVTHPLPARNGAVIEDLEDYPFLTSERGEKNSSYFSEEILSTISRKRATYVSGRAVLLDLLIGLSEYTICSGILNRNLNGDPITAIPLETEENMVTGWVGNPRIHLSEFAGKYPEELHRPIGGQSQGKTYPKTPSIRTRIRKSGW